MLEVLIQLSLQELICDEHLKIFNNDFLKLFLVPVLVNIQHEQRKMYKKVKNYKWSEDHKDWHDS